MPAHSSSAVYEPSSQVVTPQPNLGTDLPFEVRWAAWLERGRQHDLAVRRKVRIALVCAAAIGLLVAIFFGVAAGVR